MRVLITGDMGFVGKHLREYLEYRGDTVYGYDIRRGEDLRDFEKLRTVLDETRPQRIFHLAALAYVPESFINPQRAIDVNIIGSLNLLEAVRQLGIKTRIQMAGTSEEYGDSPNVKGVVTEKATLRPLSPYAIAKAAMDHFGQLYAKSYNMPIIITRAFNHAGPGRGEMYAESAFAKQIVEIENGTRKILEHGNLESIRNYSDVRDIVRAYALAVELEPGVYNICSDQNVTMQEMLDKLISFANVEIKTEVNQSLYRPADFSFKKPSCKKFKELTNWQPTISLNETLRDILEDWRMRI